MSMTAAHAECKFSIATVNFYTPSACLVTLHVSFVSVFFLSNHFVWSGCISLLQNTTPHVTFVTRESISSFSARSYLTCLSLFRVSFQLVGFSWHTAPLSFRSGVFFRPYVTMTKSGLVTSGLSANGFLDLHAYHAFTASMFWLDSSQCLTLSHLLEVFFSPVSVLSFIVNLTNEPLIRLFT